MAAPTVVGSSASSWAPLASTATTGTVTVAAGDLIVACAGVSDSATSITSVTSTAGTLTYAGVINATNYPRLNIYSGVVTSAGSRTCTINAGDASSTVGLFFVAFRGATGIGTVAVNQTTGVNIYSNAFSTVANNSAVCVLAMSKAGVAATGGGRSFWAPDGAGTEVTFSAATATNAYGGYYADLGANGSKSVGCQAFVTGTPNLSFILVEVMGSRGTLLTQQGAG